MGSDRRSLPCHLSCFLLGMTLTAERKVIGVMFHFIVIHVDDLAVMAAYKAIVDAQTTVAGPC